MATQANPDELTVTAPPKGSDFRYYPLRLPHNIDELYHIGCVIHSTLPSGITLQASSARAYVSGDYEPGFFDIGGSLWTALESIDNFDPSCLLLENGDKGAQTTGCDFSLKMIVGILQWCRDVKVERRRASATSTLPVAWLPAPKHRAPPPGILIPFMQADAALAIIMSYFDDFNETQRRLPSLYTTLCRGRAMDSSPMARASGGLGRVEVRLLPPNGHTSNCHQRPALRTLHALWSPQCYGIPSDQGLDEEDAQFAATFWLKVFGKNTIFINGPLKPEVQQALDKHRGVEHTPVVVPKKRKAPVKKTTPAK